MVSDGVEAIVAFAIITITIIIIIVQHQWSST